MALFQATLDEATDPWGVQVERVEVKDVRVPEQLQRAMAAEAEAAREARAKVSEEARSIETEKQLWGEGERERESEMKQISQG